MKWVVYVTNRRPTHVVKDITPKEAWSGVNPYVNHFRIFGCLTHVHVRDVHIRKLDSKPSSLSSLVLLKIQRLIRYIIPLRERPLLEEMFFLKNPRGGIGTSQVQPKNLIM